jgi:hypothetical protein
MTEHRLEVADVFTLIKKSSFNAGVMPSLTSNGRLCVISVFAAPLRWART